MHTNGAHASGPKGPSLLEAVATHEAGLMAQLHDVEQQGRQLADEAQAESAAFLADDYAQLERDIAEMRRRAAEERETEAASIRKACDDKVAAIRARAAQQVEPVFSEVVRRVLPRA